ncbi:MAG: hypothetical protein ING89_19925 [Rubrivivax sp.]|nr:hypothetical protein [Rubrivivax sp.]
MIAQGRRRLIVIVALQPVGPGTSIVRLVCRDCASRGTSNTWTGRSGGLSCAVLRAFVEPEHKARCVELRAGAGTTLTAHPPAGS